MKALAFSLALLVAACGAPTTGGDAIERGDLKISGGWARPTPNGAVTGAGYLRIENTGDTDDVLIGASSPRAASVELHATEMSGGVMSMARQETLAVPARGVLELKPGGRHLMFFSPTTPFVAGESVPLTLSFQSAGAVDYPLTVREADGDEAGGH